MLVRMSAAGRRARRAAASSGRTSPRRGHVLDGHDDLEFERLARAGVDDRDLATGPDAAQEPGDRLERPLRRGQPDPLHRPGVRPSAAERLEALEREREVRATLRAGDRVDLVDDDRLDAAEVSRAALVSMR